MAKKAKVIRIFFVHTDPHRLGLSVFRLQPVERKGPLEFPSDEVLCAMWTKVLPDGLPLRVSRRTPQGDVVFSIPTNVAEKARKDFVALVEEYMREHKMLPS